jgi:hypothetical protein
VLACELLLLANRQIEGKRRDNLLRNLVLYCENVRQFAIETFSPDMSARTCVDQLGGDTHAVAGFPHAAF